VILNQNAKSALKHRMVRSALSKLRCIRNISQQS